jgi:hypothetical protein
MSETLLSVRPAFGTWKRGSLHVEYSLGVLEEIRRTVQEGFHKIPHGGVETGGLLYGKWDGTVLTVVAWRPLQCEHPLGPRFQLSPTDEAALATQLAGEVPELEEFQAVGWFASHSRGALQLRGPDVDLHAKYFPEPWQTILLLCASRNQPMQAAFYSRMDANVGVGSEVVPLEVIPNPTAVPRPARRAVAPGPNRERPGAGLEAGDSMRILASQVGSEPPQMLDSETAGAAGGAWVPLESAAASPWASRGYEREEGSAPTIEPPAPATAPTGELLAPMVPDGVTQPALIQQDSEAPVEGPLEIFAPSYAGGSSDDGEEQPRFTAPVASGRKIPWRRVAWAALWLAVAGGGVYAIPRLSVPATAADPGVLNVQVAEIGAASPGQLAIRWDLKAPSNTTLREGEITVVDGTANGSERRTFALAPMELRAGSLTYWRLNDAVDVTVTVQTGRTGSGQSVTGKAQFAAAKTDVGNKTDVRRLREQLKMERARGRELERKLGQQQRKP